MLYDWLSNVYYFVALMCRSQMKLQKKVRSHSTVQYLDTGLFTEIFLPLQQN